ncbi:MAG: cysteine desulfurase [Crocinitomicaceae bacterium]
MRKFDVNTVRKDFPLLARQVYGKPLVYFDNGATAQKPQVVIDRINQFYKEENANIHRGVHHLSQVGTDLYEESRKTIQGFLNAKFSEEIIFTKGTTDSINLVAFGYSKMLKPGDEVLITEMEHHSNIVPWQMACEYSGATCKYIPLNEKGELDLSQIDSLINSNTKVVAVTHVSNSLGTINPIEKLIEKAHKVGARILIDGAQSLQHFKVDVQALDVDFYVFSGHKLFGPTGTGILYGKKEALDQLPPYQGGGDMIKEVKMRGTTYNELPHKFEAGTPNIAGGIALKTAIDYFDSFDIQDLQKYEQELLEYAESEIKKLGGIRIIGEADEKVSVLSFVVDGAHHFDVGTLLDKQGIAVRTGHHCTQPVMDFFGISGTVRASFAFYNTKEEIDQFIQALKRALTMLG